MGLVQVQDIGTHLLHFAWPLVHQSYHYPHHPLPYYHSVHFSQKKMIHGLVLKVSIFNIINISQVKFAKIEQHSFHRSLSHIKTFSFFFF